MLKFELETSSSAVAITKPINQPVRWFKISRVGWFGSKRRYTEKGTDVVFTIGWANPSKSWFADRTHVEVIGNVPLVRLRAEVLFGQVNLCDYGRGIDIVRFSKNEYAIRDADYEMARIFIYKATLGYSDADDYMLTVLDEGADLTPLFLYVFCIKFVLVGDDAGEIRIG